MKKIELEISDELWGQLEEARKQSGLTSLTDFLLAVLQQYVDRNETQTASDEDEQIRNRLENLGYM